MKSQPCSRRVLSSGDHTLVEHCSCGYVHLTIGAITVRLMPEALPALALTMTDAARAMLSPRTIVEEAEVYS